MSSLANPGLLLKSGTQLTQEEMARKAARNQTRLQCADAYLKEMLKAGGFVGPDNVAWTHADMMADYALVLAEALLSKWELGNQNIGESKQ
jgi:hypothetical protein